MSNDILFPTSIVGSMPRPDYVKDLINDETSASPDEYRRLMRAAVESVVALQECAGLDVVSDGEWWRKSYIGVIAELAHGFELGRNPADGRPWTIVVDRLSPKTPGFIAQEVAQVYPHAVTRVPEMGNRMAVNYAAVPKGMMAMGAAHG